MRTTTTFATNNSGSPPQPNMVHERDRAGKTALHYCTDNPTLACIDQVTWSRVQQLCDKISIRVDCIGIIMRLVNTLLNRVCKNIIPSIMIVL